MKSELILRCNLKKLYSDLFKSLLFTLLKTKKMRKILIVVAIVILILLALYFWSNSEKNGPVTSGDTVYIIYNATFSDNGETYETVTTPVKVKIWNGDILTSIDDQLLWMNKGEEKKFVITPEQGFWSRYDATLTRVLPAQYFTVWGRTINVGDVVSLDWRNWLVIGMQWSEWNQLLTIDLNPKYTWSNIDYSVIIKQIGWKDFNPANI